MRKVKCWAVCLATDNYFIPDFSVEDKFTNVMQIHSTKKAAAELATELGKGWEYRECELIIK